MYVFTPKQWYSILISKQYFDILQCLLTCQIDKNRLLMSVALFWNCFYMSCDWAIKTIGCPDGAINIEIILKVHCTECESFLISFLPSSQNFELSLYPYTSQIWNPAWPLQLMILTIPPLTSRLIMTTKFFQSKYICCLVQMTMDLRHMTFILLVLMDCEVISYVHNNGYGRNFKYRKKVFQAPTIVEYPVFKQFDGRFR